MKLKMTINLWIKLRVENIFELIAKAIHLTGDLQWIMIYLSCAVSEFEDKLIEEFTNPLTNGGYAGFMIYLDCREKYTEDRFWKALEILSSYAPLDALVTCISFDIQFKYEGEQVGMLVTLNLDGKYHITSDYQDYFEAGKVIDKFEKALRENALKVALKFEEQ